MIIDLYHGSEKIIESPTLQGGGFYNDYGQGFYCTKHIDLAKEWAVSTDRDGFVSHYLLNTESLKVLNLNSEPFSILHWLTILLDHRVVDFSSPIALDGFAYLKNHYDVNLSKYDVILGYRADDSYFSFARAFLLNTITVEQLEKSMYLGELGEQYFLKSKKAFSQLIFQDFSFVNHEEFYPFREKRDQHARLAYQDILKESSNGTYLIDLIRKEG